MSIGRKKDEMKWQPSIQTGLHMVLVSQMQQIFLTYRSESRFETTVVGWMLEWLGSLSTYRSAVAGG